MKLIISRLELQYEYVHGGVQNVFPSCLKEETDTNIYFQVYITVYKNAEMLIPWNIMHHWYMVPFPGINSNGIISNIIRNQSLICCCVITRYLM